MGTIHDAVRRIFSKHGSGYRFPSDLIWEYLEGTLPEPTAKPGLIKALNRDGYIAATGLMTTAVSGARKGSPTKEYTFGSEIDPASISLVAAFDAPPESATNFPQDTTVRENKFGKMPLPHELQRIIHGCPGSGKSHMLAQDAMDAHYVIRCVFFPESSYFDFVGGLRPQSIYRIAAESDAPKYIGSALEIPGEPVVHYVVQPGPFLKAYQLACLNPKKSVVLIVEEISRAVAAHVFGDILQLLDRSEEGESDGYSKYEIEARPDIQAWLLLNEVWHDQVSAGNLRLPPNLYIWATMNRADQNARQLDAAFLRRWDKAYVSYLEPGAFDDTEVPYGGTTVSWGKLRQVINARLASIGGVPEDKFVGPYMISRRKLSDPSVIYEDLWGYLWNDVLKNRAQLLFGSVTTFAELKSAWAFGQGLPIGELSTE